ncbi:MAG: hypothetical protein ABFC96_04045 [Thermoguttaceae bacterium]
MPQPNDYVAKRSDLEELMRQLPGFRGYLDRDCRRESDELLRNWMADRLERSKRAIDELARRLADAAAIDLLPMIDRLRVRLDRLLARIRGAMQGYSGLFDLVAIDAPLLDRVYEHDAQLGQQVDAFTALAEQLRQPNSAPATIAELLRQSDEIERQWDGREEILKGVK